MASIPRVLVSWHTDPHYIPPPLLYPGQVTLAPLPSRDRSLSIHAITPLGTYDLPELLKTAGIDSAFDIIAVSADCMMSNRPTGLECLRGRKILLLGDTHHREKPLSMILKYAFGQPFDLVIGTYTRQHLHWFVEAGYPHIAWLPGLTHHAMPRRMNAQRRASLVFLGQMSERHVRRARLAARLQAANIPLNITGGTLEDAANLYGSNVVSWNASLNGDLNLRIFEVLAAGGCLLTDKLSPLAGLDQFLQAGTHYVEYCSDDDLLEQAARLLSDPHYAYTIALAGTRVYDASLSPGHWRSRFQALVEHGREPAGFPADDIRMPLYPTAKAQEFLPRLVAYEAAQAMHAARREVNIAVSGNAGSAIILDLLDLPRANLTVMNANDDLISRIEAASALLSRKVNFLNRGPGAGGQFNLAVIGPECPHINAELVITMPA